jgi:hypothetical protein
MTPEVEFHPDDFPYGYFTGPPDRADTMLSDDGRVDVPIGDLFSKLDSLDDFFDDLSTSPPSDGRSSRTVTEFSPDTFESGAQLYDEQILPILHQASNNSNTSFQNGFADRPILMPREGGGGGPANNTMNPGAFNVGISGAPSSSAASTLTLTTSITPPNRPGLHARSVTSPSAPASYHPQLAPGELTSDDEFPEDVFSDGDDERPGTANGEGAGGSFFLENVIRPLTQGTRSRMRRMTGGRSRDGGFPFNLPHPPPPPPPLAAGSLSTMGGGGGSLTASPQQVGTGVGAAVPKVPAAFLGQQSQQGQGLGQGQQGQRPQTPGV